MELFQVNLYVVVYDVHQFSSLYVFLLSSKKVTEQMKVTLCHRVPRLPASPSLILNFSISLTCGFALPLSRMPDIWYL